MRRTALALFALLAAAAGFAAARTSRADDRDSPRTPRSADSRSARASQADDPLTVRTVRSGSAEFVVARADMRRARLRMLSRDGGAQSFADAERALRERGERLLLATNGGLFHDGAPIGLHVEDGRAVRPLNLDTAPPPGHRPGNFYYLPNAVLFQDRSGDVTIRDARRMRGRTEAVRDGLQSGPALLLDGAAHRVARPPNRGVPHASRSAACVVNPRELLIVFAPDPTTFPQLTRFLAAQGCRDAVFLDANVPGIYAPGHGIDIPESSPRSQIAASGGRGMSGESACRTDARRL